MKIDGKEISSEILQSLKPQIRVLNKTGITPILAIILIGNNKSSKSYIKQKQLKAAEIGVEIKLFTYENISETELIKKIEELNSDPEIHGIIVQRPLPDTINKELIERIIKPEKDVDGFSDESTFDTPVALAVIEILKSIEIDDLLHKKIVVIGKGETAGLPVIKLLDKMELTFEIIDSKTENPNSIIKKADIIISAVGKENVITPDLLNKHQILMGIGLFLKDGKLKGDYENSEVENKVKYFTPTVGGVGPVNVAILMKNLVHAAASQGS
jgi:methylenetetrahydrofolate dehydrogenase (NADP+)/methenyltetrahydrofolate cyclohydrolase